MKVNGNNFQSGDISVNKTFVQNGQCLGLKTDKPFIKDSFQKNLYVTVPKPVKKSNISVNSYYSPKQLLRAYSHPAYVNSLIEENPKISKMLESKGLTCQIYPENITNITNSHITTTTAYALEIANQLNLSDLDKQILEQACVFHDFGKILVPSELINKPGELTQEEKEIVDLHAILGYELLSGTGMNSRVLNLIKNHHSHSEDNQDILGQILSVADIYSALREERSYKKPLDIKAANKILDEKVKNGELNAIVVEALKNSQKKNQLYAA